MGLSFFIQCACLVSFLVSLTQVQARRRVFDVTGYGARADRRTDNSKVVLIFLLLIQEIKDDEGVS